MEINMELRHLRYFTAVVKWKSYREASRRIHVAQPAISQTVTDLDVLSEPQFVGQPSRSRA